MKPQIANSKFQNLKPLIHTTYYILHSTFLILFTLCSTPFAVRSQYFNPGTDPASVKWNQVKSEHYKIIYPRELDSIAVYTANAFEYFRAPGSASLDVLPSKWPVILHNRTVISNGFTPYAPKRIEFITTPPQDDGSTFAQNWIDQLVIHEFRHSVQYAAVDRGMTRVLKYLLGQQALPGILGLFVPWWFIEGDAVVTETANSHTGRGRSPGFEMKLRAQFLEKDIYSYDKAVNGSFKNFIPNHYELGYLLVGKTREEFGQETFSNVMRKTGNLPIMLVPFSNTLYKETGFGKSRLYNYTTDKLRQEWDSVDKATDLSEYDRVVIKAGKYYTDYVHPAVLGDGRIVALRKSIDDIPRIVITDQTGQEQILFTPGPLPNDFLSAEGHLVCWSEIAYDPRWNYRTYSVIKIHDVDSGTTRQLTKKSRYFSPVINPDRKQVLAVEVDETNRCFLVILHASSGEVIRKLPAPDGIFLSYPTWSGDGEKIAVTMTRSEGKALALFDAFSGKHELLTPFSYVEISKPFFSGRFVFFTGAYTGINNIFASDTSTGKIFQVTSSRFGAADAVADPTGTQLIYADYTSDGYCLVSTEVTPEDWKEQDPEMSFKWKLAEDLAAQEQFTFISTDVPDSSYAIKPYRKGLNLFNFHSWAPLSIDVDNMDVNPGVTLLSQNLLGSSTATLNYSWDMNEETGKYSLKYSYEGQYPVFDLSADYGMRKGIHVDSLENNINYKYHQLDLTAGARVPFNWGIRGWWVGAQPYAGYTIAYRKMLPGTNLEFLRDRYNSLSYDLFLYAQSRMSERDLQPRWGQVVDINYRHTPFDPDPLNSIFVTEGVLYFPGIVRHHGFKAYLGYQNRIQYYSTYPVLITTPRGYTGLYPNKAFSSSLGYSAPLFYPDWHIGPLLYLKRIKTTVFYDFMMAFDHPANTNYQSAGLDLSVDFHVFRWFVPFEAGLRTIFLPDESRWEFEFLYSVNIGDLY